MSVRSGQKPGARSILYDFTFHFYCRNFLRHIFIEDRSTPLDEKIFSRSSGCYGLLLREKFVMD